MEGHQSVLVQMDSGSTWRKSEICMNDRITVTLKEVIEQFVPSSLKISDACRRVEINRVFNAISSLWADDVISVDIENLEWILILKNKEGYNV
jgi:hypothetical protein